MGSNKVEEVMSTSTPNMVTYHSQHAEERSKSSDLLVCSDAEDSWSDEGVGRSLTALNYSREDILVLVSQAERMVRGRRVEEEDSDYSSSHPTSSMVTSEPSLATTSRSSPRRRELRSRRREWRSSLPSCLSTFHHSTTSSPSEEHLSAPELSDEHLSAPEFSELWEEEQPLVEELFWSEEEEQ